MIKTNKLLGVVLVVLVLSQMGCAGTKDGTEAVDRTPRRVKMLEQPNEYVVPGLIASNPSIRTAQLYRQPDESSIPIIAINTGERLMLEFDLYDEPRRPLSVYFYHADRRWRRDLTQSQYLDSFHRDDILEYQDSRATEMPYVHYEYEFPNSAISFRVSGNYVVRVTEQGAEDDVLLERAFYVTEQLTPVELGLATVVQASSAFPAVQPITLFTPPDDIGANVFGYAVCFVQNGRSGASRCTDRASLSRPPALEYYLRPQSSFGRLSGDYFLDLSRLDIGGTIEHADLTVSPYDIVLQPDFLNFSDGDLYPLLNGQPVVRSSVRDTPDPATQGEYVRVLFAVVPPGEKQLPGTIHIVGSFNNWQATPDNAMTWYSDEGRYEGNIIVKQGHYEYRYVALERDSIRDIGEGFPRQDYEYTSFVYYQDALLLTDRLIGVASARLID